MHAECGIFSQGTGPARGRLHKSLLYHCASAQLVPHPDSSNPPSPVTHLTDTKFSMNNLQPAQLTATLPESYRGIILNTLNRNREDILSAVQGFVDSIPAPSMAPGHAARRESVDRFLADNASTLIRLTTRAGMGQEAVTAFMGTLRSHLRAFIVTAGMSSSSCPPSIDLVC